MLVAHRCSLPVPNHAEYWLGRRAFASGELLILGIYSDRERV